MKGGARGEQFGDEVREARLVWTCDKLDKDC